MKKLVPTIFSFSFLFLSCTKEVITTPQQLKDFLENSDNGLLQLSDANGIETKVMYHPKDLIIANNYITETDFSEELIDSTREELRDYQYFKLSLSRSGEEVINAFGQDTERFSKAVNYLSFGISADVKLQVNNKEFDIEDVAYSRSFGSSRSSNVLVAFKPGVLPSTGKLVITFSDSFFSTGYHSYEFDLSKIKEIPTLNLLQNL